MTPRLHPVLACLALLTLLGPTRVGVAGPESAFTPAALGPIVLDGTPAPDEWRGATLLPIGNVRAPRVEGEGGPSELAPDVRVGLSGGRLCVAVRMDEPAGTAMGLHLMIAPEGTASAAAAVSLDYRPMELRAPRYRVLGPRGVGRPVYRLEGAVDWTAGAVRHEGGTVHTTPAAWTLEAAIPVVDLVGESAAQVLRLAVVAYTRTPNVIGAWPAGAVWKGPAAWGTLRPPEGGWPLAVDVDVARLAAEDAADALRQEAWLQYLRGASTPLLPLAPRDVLLTEVRKNLIAPLETLLVHRPDLRAPVLCIEGDVFHRLGLGAEAAEAYRQAVGEGRGWPEARYGLDVKVGGPAYAQGEVDGPTDFRRARDRIALRGRLLPPPQGLEEAGLRLGAALLDHKEGRFAEAIPVLEELARKYPFDAFLEAHARMAHRGLRAAGEEAQLVKRDAQAPLPRAVVETTRGPFTLELFQRDAGNSVSNFVWLAQSGFYDGVAIHHTVPFFATYTGDPHTKEGAAHPEQVGTGGPGYAIRTEAGARRPLRGYLAFVGAGRDTEGSQFLLFTGTAIHLQGDLTVFGRVVEGMEVVDALRAGPTPDRILTVQVQGLEEGRTYRPTDLSGAPAPTPREP